MIHDNNYSNILIPELTAWSDYFNDLTIYRINILVKHLEKVRAKKIIYPETSEVFRIFKDTAPESTRVIILGQDPYYDGNANGYAFGCKKRISPSLKQIWNNMSELPSILKPHEVNMTLEYLVKQGVFLLNTVLTVEANVANSHKNIGWKTFTREFLINYSNYTKNRVYLLWGNSAKQYKRFINAEHNLVLTDVHPVHASRNDRKWNCNHFKIANEYLIKHNFKPINWK